jgi:lysophospholipase L1-like esterase
MTMTPLKLAFTLPAFLLFLTASAGAQKADTASNPWEEDIRKFEQADSLHPPPQGAILFVGSSSIRMWETLQQDFPGFQVINRGFGGSELADALRFADRIILPYRPRMVVVYAGDNDLANGTTPERIFSDYNALVQLIRQHLPNTEIAYISVKPSLARWNLVEKIRKTNRLIQEYSAKQKGLAYIDIFTPMLGKNGTPRKELFAPDGLHLNKKGYALWTNILKPFLSTY